MPKAKLILTNAEELKKLPVAAELAGITLSPESYKVGKEVHTEMTFREPSQLYRMGQYSRDVTEADVKAFDDRKEAKLAKRKAAQASQPIKK